MRDPRFQSYVDRRAVEVHKKAEPGALIRVAMFGNRTTKREMTMPRGDKSSYTDKQKRQAEHIEEGYEHRGVAKKEAERRAWATVNKETGGGDKSGSGRAVPDTNVSSKRGGRIGGPRGGKASASRPAAARSSSATKAAATRKRQATKRSVARKTARKK
jgi:plasmid stabilization system protein ParE